MLIFENQSDYKVQLYLEATKMKCFRVIDCLFVEACKGFITKDLFEALKTLLNGSSDRARRYLSQFLEMYMIGAYQKVVLYPLINGPFGVLYDEENELYGEFDDEVMEVMKIADHERRMRHDRFIGVDTILYALSFSRVRNHLLVKSVVSKSSPDEPPKMPAFKIYKLAGQCATYFGNEVVSLHVSDKYMGNEN